MAWRRRLARSPALTERGSGLASFFSSLPTASMPLSAMGLYHVSQFYQSEESQEGVQAFLEKRKPDFRKHQK